MKAFIGNLLFLAIILLIVTRFFSVFSGTAFPINIITSDSMRPALIEGDLIAWTPTNIEDVEIGDVIVFKSWVSWPDERLVAHRVVEIKEVWGRPAFITKGDANKWIDQAGPHIPEAMVTEKNFIGRALSIGKQPLKIPFVGILGIWINDGLKLLSQPSAEKSTLTYIGIFTPLTIALIILIISLFLFPEKAKTVKEKLRLNIFRSQSLKLKNVFSFFLILFIVLLILMHFFAFDSLTASLGVGEFPEESRLEFGSLIPGQTTSKPRQMPIINPGVMPVKGFIFGSREMEQFVKETIFEINPGQVKELKVTASVPNGTQNGSYLGEIMVFSSPLWFMFPDELIEFFYNWDAEATVAILDILSACILTAITVSLIVFLAIVGRKYREWEIDLSWHYAPKIYLKKGFAQRYRLFRKKTKKVLIKQLGWINKINLAHIDKKSMILALLVIIPLLLLINSDILAMVVASLIVGIIAYFISCKQRQKIIMASIISMIIGLGYIAIKTNYFLLISGRSIIESIALGMGAIGVYLLVLSILLVPISILSWYFTHLIRNLKERKDPLLILEGRCDL